MMKLVRTIKMFSVIPVLLVLLFSMVSCTQKVSKENVMYRNTNHNQELIGQKDNIVGMINNGEKDFLYKLSDGYFYPVEIVEPIFIETLPPKIKTILLHQKRVVALVVERLVPITFQLNELSEVEVFIENEWKTTFDGFWESKQYSAKIVDSDQQISCPLNMIRFKNVKGVGR